MVRRLGHSFICRPERGSLRVVRVCSGPYIFSVCIFSQRRSWVRERPGVLAWPRYAYTIDLLRAALGPLALRCHVDTLIRFVRTTATIAGYSTAASYFAAVTSAAAFTTLARAYLVVADRLCSRSRFCPCRSGGTIVVVWWRRKHGCRRHRSCWRMKRSLGRHLATSSVVKGHRLRANIRRDVHQPRPRTSDRYRPQG